ncbi:phosphorylase family protein [Aliarcobacter butzleri]|uniref:phosphorylase family protein n=1 Tax=Aliarcobacter butzleri TaxID=28197 RepID=UPI002B240056|nr:hypothetical protein [Aliarcobacter butzleri]
MKVLLIEDYVIKRELVIELLDKKYNHRIKIDTAESLEEAKEKIEINAYDLYILDLSLKSKDSEASIDYGLELYDILKYKAKNNLIVYSSVDNIQKIGQENLFKEHDIPFLDYTLKENTWKDELLCFIENIISNNNININDIPYDLAIITALADEFEFMKKASNTIWLENDNDDNFIYYTTRIKNKNNQSLNIVAYTNNLMGMSNAAAISMKIILKFKPKYLVMTGICAGYKDITEKGDLIIPQYVFNYQEGDIHENKFVPSYKPKELDYKTNNLINKVAKEYLIDIKNEWETTYNLGKMPANNYKVHLGKQLGTGSAVVKDQKILEDIKGYFQKDIIGLDMEAYSIFIAADNSEVNTIPIVIKAVQDFADAEKDKDYRKFACYSSARFFFKLCENVLIDKLS